MKHICRNRFCKEGLAQCRAPSTTSIDALSMEDAKFLYVTLEGGNRRDASSGRRHRPQKAEACGPQSTSAVLSAARLYPNGRAYAGGPQMVEISRDGASGCTGPIRSTRRHGITNSIPNGMPGAER